MMIPIAKACLSGNERKYINNCIDTQWISSSGSYVTQFEEVNSKYYGMKHAIAVSNGTSALHLALIALGIEKGDEVIIPAFTFAATINAILYVGATPVMVDVYKEIWTIDAELCEKAITKRTKAIIPVHIYGHPCNMEKLTEITRKHELFLVEDCAEAHGAKYKDKKVGSFGDISCFSFFGNKIITTGEGGLCLTNSMILNEKMRVLRDHGMSKKIRYWHERIGYNYRMTNLQASIGVAQMEEMENILIKRANIKNYYRQLLKKKDYIVLKPENEIIDSVNWLFSFLIEGDENIELSVMQDKLQVKGIESRRLFYPLYQMPPYKEFNVNYLKNTEEISKKGISLPTFNDLKYEEIDYIVKSFTQIIEEN
ncbi:MAG: DegT/DnrJ/EryC1/StrS family aminotransferase [Candidatus Stygibacter australis]|nr:DegT/DnrJ/EryC1/StrS family aminotransferase [Candidatus Stygibacter australis]MDP8321130.1 DegT/DnrJ/EryC1/StrS family aminotransferase [Candidatus Stygibacter australis]